MSRNPNIDPDIIIFNQSREIQCLQSEIVEEQRLQHSKEEKMSKKIVISEGCRSFYTQVDGKDVYGEYNVMSDQERDELVNYLCEKIKERYKENNIRIDDIIRLFPEDEYECDNKCCETCGDVVTKTYWEI